MRDEAPKIDTTLRCSCCRKKIPTKLDRQKMAVNSDVCLCEHNWLVGKKAVLPRVRD